MKCSLGQPLTFGFMYVQWSMLATLPKKAAASSTWSYAQLASRTATPTTHPQTNAVLCEASCAFGSRVRSKEIVEFHASHWSFSCSGSSTQAPFVT